MPPQRGPRRALALAGGALLLVVFSITTSGGCGPTAKQKAINATYAALSAGADGFAAWSARHEQDLVAEAKTREEANARLDAFERAQDVVDSSIHFAFRSLGAYAADQLALGVLLSAAADVADKIHRLEAGGAP